MHASVRRGRAAKPRVLYVFRTPPGVKIGREPFDEAIQRELEVQNPGIVFDWKALSNIPAPAPDVEFWRERRKADKAAKLARRVEEQVDAADAVDSGEHAAHDVPAELAPVSEDTSGDESDETVRTLPTVEVISRGNVGVEGRPPGQRRRQRRGGRRHRRGDRPQLGAASTPDVESQRIQAPPADAGVEGPLQVLGAPAPSEDPSKLARDASKEG